MNKKKGIFNLTSLDPTQAENNISTIRDAIDRIFKLESSQLSFEELYRCAYNLVLNKYAPKLYAAVKDKLITNIRTLETEIKALDIIANMTAVWSKYSLCLSTIKDVLMYMDKNYCEKQSIPYVQQMGYELFKEIIVDVVKPTLSAQIMSKIASHRIGNYVDLRPIKDITIMLLTIGNSNLYSDVVEQEHIRVSSEFYSSQVSLYLGKEKCVEYAKIVRRRLDEEKVIIDICFKEETYKIVSAKIIQIYITNNANQLLTQHDSGIDQLLTCCDYDSIRTIYSVFRMAEEAWSSLIIVINAFFSKEIEKEINIVKQEANNSKYIDALLKIKDIFSATYMACEKDQKFYFKMKEEIETSISKYTTSYALAKYCNDLFKPSCRLQGDEIEKAILGIIDLFRLISDKDAFELHFRTLFAKRMLSISSYYITGNEKNFLSRLKTECGCNYTSRLDNMTQDIEISEKLKKDFEFSSTSIEFNIKIISCGNWPVSTESCVVFLPHQLSTLETNFTKFYQRLHNGRVVNFIPSQGNCTLILHIKSKSYEISMTTLQAAMAILFNSKDSISVSQIMVQTNINYQDSVRELLSFLKTKILLSNSEELNEDTLVSFNKDFNHKLHNFALPIMKKPDAQAKEDDRCIEQLNESRKVMTDAYIVKVMKTSKKMDHNSLMAEVIKYISYKFKPEVQFVKLRIEAMIEREFLERSKEEKGMYIYKS